MARYTQHYTVAVIPNSLNQSIIDILKSCNLPIVYSTGDYVLAQESVGQVAYAKLVTVEVLIHQSSIQGDQIRLTCVTKNGELPLREQNHCRDMAELVGKAFESNSSWQMLENIPG
jgi:hypothetical protein